MRQLKLLAQTPLPTGGKEIHLDSTPTPLAPNVGTNFNGLGQNGWIPYDAALAVGPNQIVVMTNAQWIVYDRAGATVRAVTDFGAWWGTPAGEEFDPKCFYDAVANRFVMLTVSQTTTGGNKAFYHLSISQTGNPTGAWFNYQFDAKIDGTTSTSNWADFPGLGFDDNAVYVTSNQFGFSGLQLFHYAKIRVLSKAQLYAGNAATFTDFVGAALQNSDSSQAFTIQPARTLSSTSSEYFLNTNSNSNNTVTLWRIDGAPGSPTLVRQATYSIGTFAVPPDAPQKNTTTKIATNDDRMYDIVWRSGVIHASFGESFSGLAAIRYLRLDTAGNTVLKDVTYTQPNVHYYYPAVTDDSAGNLYVVFSRSSSAEFASVYHTGMQPADIAIQPSALIKAGVSTNTTGRWGDYSAISNDPSDSLAVVSYAGWANTSNRWATWITGATFTGSVPTPTLVSVNPSSGTQGTNVNVTLTGQNTNWVQGTSVINISGTGVTASNINVTGATSLTATFNIGASAATGSRSVTVTTGSEVTTSASFTVNASSGAAPTLSSLSPNHGNQGQSVNVTLAGTNFVVGQTTINVSGTGVTTMNLNVTNTTQATVTMVVAANAALGNYNVTVTTSGGTSNAKAFVVYGVPFISMISPANGAPGTSPTVTLTGSNFLGGNATITGSGVTLSNRVINGTWTQLTYTFAVSSSAALGLRSVTVTTPAGTSNAVTFNVGSAPAPPTLGSVSPNNGNPGQTVNATLTGTNFLTGASVGVSGSGVTASNVVVVNTTTIAVDLTIGAAAAAGARNVSVTTGGGTSGTQSFTVNSGSSLAITTVSLPNGTVGVAYNSGLSASGGTSPYTWAITVGSLPSGLNLDPNTGAITGTPGVAAAGTTNFTAQVTDANLQTATKALSITVNSNTPSVTTTSLPNGSVGVAYNSSVAASGGVTPYTWAIILGALPNNLNLDPNTGAITGSPTAAGTFNFTVQVTDAFAQTATKALSISVNSAPSVVTTSLPNGTFGVAYNSSVTATGGTTPYSWSIFSGALPASLNLNPSTGAITGTPTAAGTSNFTVMVTDALAQTAARALSIIVTAPVPTLNVPSPNSGNQGQSVNVTLTGANFIIGQTTINVGGTGVTASNFNVNSSTQATVTMIVAANSALGDHGVTLTTPGGTSNSRAFTVYGVPAISSINPAGGNVGTSLTVTFTGTNFINAQATVSGTGITLSNRVVNGTWTQLSYTFTIAAGAATGPRTVTLTSPAGTSNPVTFTVN